MKRIIILCLALAVYGCKKDDPQPVMLPVFTCGDASDDGKFEHWNEKEQALINGGIIWANSRLSDAPTAITISRSVLGPNDSLAFTYIQNIPVNSYLRIHYANRPSRDQLGFYSDKARDTVGGVIWRQGSDSLTTPGCGRLYYMFVDSTGTVVDKGHFDISFQL